MVFCIAVCGVNYEPHLQHRRRQTKAGWNEEGVRSDRGRRGERVREREKGKEEGTASTEGRFCEYTVIGTRCAHKDHPEL